MPGELERLQASAGADPGGRVEAQRLVDRHLQLGQRLAVELGRRRRPAAQHAVLLLLEPGQRAGLAGQLVEQERDGGGRGVVAREQQRHHLVAHLAVGEARSVLVARLHRQREDVLAEVVLLPTAGDLGIDQPIEAATGWKDEARGERWVALRHPSGSGPALTMGPEVAAKDSKARVHLDVAPRPDGDVATEVERLVRLGATHVDIGQGHLPWTVLADPEGNEFCVFATQGAAGTRSTPSGDPGT